MSRALPGFDTPAVGFEQPFEMLGACHERVRRSLALLQRLLEHVGSHGHDEQSRSAAGDVLRYFDIAAPHHHEDEEQQVFPLLLARGEPGLRELVDRLQHDHRRMAALWVRLRVPLAACAQGLEPSFDAELRQLAQEFIAIYPGHLQAEEERVFPVARSLVDARERAAMGALMQARRREG